MCLMCLTLFLDIKYMQHNAIPTNIHMYHTPQHITSVWGSLTLTPIIASTVILLRFFY